MEIIQELNWRICHKFIKRGARAERGLLTNLEDTIPYKNYQAQLFLCFAFFTTVPENSPKTVRSSKNAEKWPNRNSHFLRILYKDKCSGNQYIECWEYWYSYYYYYYYCSYYSVTILTSCHPHYLLVVGMRCCMYACMHVCMFQKISWFVMIFFPVVFDQTWCFCWPDWR